jgi:hypothetical protein
MSEEYYKRKFSPIFGEEEVAMAKQSKAKTPQYCTSCAHHRRLNTWQKDYCMAKKKLCKDIRHNKQGGFARVECNGYEEK